MTYYTDTARATAQAREALIRVEGPTGEHIAELLTRSAISQDDTYLRTIGAFNRANTGTSPVSPPLSQSRVSDGWSGALLDLIAAPESLTGRFLAHPLNHPVAPRRPVTRDGAALEIDGAELHNLRKVNARIPLGDLDLATAGRPEPDAKRRWQTRPR